MTVENFTGWASPAFFFRVGAGQVMHPLWLAQLAGLVSSLKIIIYWSDDWFEYPFGRLPVYRGAKTQKFPGSNFLCAKTFRMKCTKPFLTTSLKSALLPLTTLPKNA